MSAITVKEPTSAPSFLFISSKNLDFFRGQSWHREAYLIARGLLYGDWKPLLEKNILVDGSPLRLDWYQSAFIQNNKPKLIEKSRRIGLTTALILKRLIRSQYVPIPMHSVSLTQHHTEEAMRLYDSYYAQLPNRLRARRLVDRSLEKHHLILGDSSRKGSAYSVSKVQAHACSSNSVRGLEGDIDLDEFAFYPYTLARNILKTITPVTLTMYKDTDDVQRHFDLNIISTHFGDGSVFNELIEKKHDLYRLLQHKRLPWTVCPRLCKNIHIEASGSVRDEFLEEMCCIPLAEKTAAFPFKSFERTLKEMEFDQWGTRVFRDKEGRVQPFERNSYDFVSLGSDYASFKAETTFFAFGLRGAKLDVLCYKRLTPELCGGVIEEPLIWQVANMICGTLRPDYFAYDATGVGQYLSKVLFDPVYGFKENRRPRTDKYPYAEGAEPVEITTNLKNECVSKLKIGLQIGMVHELPLDEFLPKQLRNFKRTLTPTGIIKHAAQDKGKKPGALDDIVIAILLAIYPFHIEDTPVLATDDDFERNIIEMDLHNINEIPNIGNIYTSDHFSN